MTKEKAITIIESHKAHWQRLLREKICDETEGREAIEGFDMAISALSESDNVGMSMSHRAIAKVIDDYIANHKGDSDKQYTAYEIKTLLISDDSGNKGEWIESKERSKHWYCSVCGGIHTDPETGKWRETFDYRYPFCPNCGADMRPRTL